jgi:hypothetical protein
MRISKLALSEREYISWGRERDPECARRRDDEPSFRLAKKKTEMESELFHITTWRLCYGGVLDPINRNILSSLLEVPLISESCLYFSLTNTYLMACLAALFVSGVICHDLV